MYVRKALGTVLFIWCLHVIVLLEVSPRYITLFPKGMFHPCSCSTGPRDIASAKTQQKTPLPTIPLLLHDVTLSADHIENTVPINIPVGYIVWHDIFHCCIAVYCAIT
jgi:hypothetical protein